MKKTNLRLGALAFGIAALNVTGAAWLLTNAVHPHYDPPYTYLVVNHKNADLQVIFPFDKEADCARMAEPAHGTCLSGEAAKKLFSETSRSAQVGLAAVKRT